MLRSLLLTVVATTTLSPKLVLAQAAPAAPEISQADSPDAPAPQGQPAESASGPTQGEAARGAPSEVPSTAPPPEEADPAGASDRIQDLETRVEALSKQLEEQELQQLTVEAEQAAGPPQAALPPEQREFRAGSLSLQQLNPELSFSGDLLAQVIINDQDFYASEFDRSGLVVRGAGLHLQHDLDPYSRFKSALHISPEEGLGLEEMYVTWYGLIPSVSFSVGRFRQSFGVVNRWHEHALDQTSFPTALTFVLGEEGLVGDGVSVTWLPPPLWAHANELTLEVVDGSNETLFSGQHFSVPSALLRLKSYYDLAPSTYLELGLTGMAGANNRRGFVNEEQELANEPWRATGVGGADLTLFWSPLDRARYRSITWRTELFAARQELPRGSAPRRRESWGAYSYVQTQFSARWIIGVRGDVARPTLRAAGDPCWDIVPYLTFLPSEFVYLRLEGRHSERFPYQRPDETLRASDDDRILLQLDFAAGPHKHEKY